MNIDPVCSSAIRESNTRALPPAGSIIAGSNFSSPRRSRATRLTHFPETLPTDITAFVDWSASPKKIHDGRLGLMKTAISSCQRSPTQGLDESSNPKLKSSSPRKQGTKAVKVSSKNAPKRRSKETATTGIGGEALDKGADENSPGLHGLPMSENERNLRQPVSKGDSKIDPPGLFVDEIALTKSPSKASSRSKGLRSGSKSRSHIGEEKSHPSGSPRKRKDTIISSKKTIVSDTSQQFSIDKPFAPELLPFARSRAVSLDNDSLLASVSESLAMKPKRSDAMTPRRRGSDVTSTTQTSHTTTKSGSGENDESAASTGRIKSPTRRQRSLSLKKSFPLDASAEWMSPRKATNHVSGFLDESTAVCTTPFRSLSENGKSTVASPTKRTGRVSRTVSVSTRSRKEKSIALFDSSPFKSTMDDEETVLTWTRVRPLRQSSKSSLEMVATRPAKKATNDSRPALKESRDSQRNLSVSKAQAIPESGETSNFHIISRKPTMAKAIVASNLIPLDFTDFQPEDFSTVEFDDPVVLIACAPSQAIEAEGHDSLWSLTALHG